MKIVLCNPEVNLKYSHSRKGMYPPLGLLSLATYLERAYPGELDIEVIDGDVGLISPKEFMGADLVGFHADSYNYGNCLELASKAKGQGAKIIFGGAHATVLWKNIMRNREFIDYIVINEGEIPLSWLVGKLLNKDNISLAKIPNLIYRDERNNPVPSPAEHVNQASDMLIPSRRYVDIEKYIHNYRRVYEADFPFRRPLSVYSSKGCEWRDKTGGCVFCARLEVGVRYRHISQIWKEIEELRELYGADYIWDISDDNLASPEWFKRFVEERPPALSNIAFLVYSRIDRITEDVVPYLKRLNVFEVYLGLESGDKEILRKAMKGVSTDTSLKIARRLRESGIYYFPSFIIGLPGENEASLNNTLQFAQQLAEIGGFLRISATILMPIPGSQVYDILRKDEKYGSQISASDIAPIDELEKKWIERYTHIDYPTAQKYQNLINNLSPKSSKVKSFGGKI